MLPYYLLIQSIGTHRYIDIDIDCSPLLDSVLFCPKRVVFLKIIGIFNKTIYRTIISAYHENILSCPTNCKKVLKVNR